MKQFDTFSEYMFDLLFAPLKKGRKTANQLRIFFKRKHFKAARLQNITVYMLSLIHIPSPRDRG